MRRCCSPVFDFVFGGFLLSVVTLWRWRRLRQSILHSIGV